MSNIITIKERISIVDICAKYNIEINKNSFCCCPFHIEKTPSCKIDKQNNKYYCFGCNIGGDVINFYEKINCLTTKEAIIELSSILGLSTEYNSSGYKIMNDIANMFYTNLNNQAFEYIKSRGISDESIIKWSIGYADHTTKIYDNLIKNGYSHQEISITGVFNDYKKCKFAGRIIFPIRNKYGHCIAFGGRSVNDSVLPKYINSAENSMFKKREILYGFNHIKNGKVIYIVEGYTDVIAISQIGLENVVGVLGTAINKYHIQQLFEKTNNVNLVFDGDAAGINAANKTIMIILSELTPGKNIKITILPENTDPDSVIQKYGSAKLLELIQKGEDIVDYIISLCKKNNPKHDTDLADKSKFEEDIKNIILSNIGCDATVSNCATVNPSPPPPP